MRRSVTTCPPDHAPLLASQNGVLKATATLAAGEKPERRREAILFWLSEGEKWMPCAKGGGTVTTT